MKKIYVWSLVLAFAIPPTLARADDAEPAYNSASQVLIFQDELNNYNTFADAVSGGWLCTNQGTAQDTSTNPLGACQIIDNGYDGAGKAIRLVYDGIGQGTAKQEGHSWSRKTNDPLAGKPGNTFYTSYYFRVNPNGFNIDQDSNHSIFVKGFEMWNSIGRAQFGTGYQLCGRVGTMAGYPLGGGGTFFGFVGNSAGAHAPPTCNAAQIKPPYMSTGQGQWHRLTYKYVSQSGAGGPVPVYNGGTGVGNRDGVAQMWYDGTLIVSVGKNYCGVPVPGGVPVGYPINPPEWCTNDDLDAMYVNAPVSTIGLGGVAFQTALLTRSWSFDFDHFIVWRDTGAGYVPPPAVPPTPPPATPTPTPTPTPPTPGTPDTTPPVIQSGGPSGSFEGATSATLSVSTNERSTCKFDQKSGLDYSRMSYTFALTGGAIHSQPFSGLTPQTYTFYVKCLDESKNITPSDYTITFSITGSTTPTPTPTPTDPLQDLVNLILTNRPLFTKATALGITLPPLITKVLNTGTLTQSDLTSLSSTLTVSTPTTYTFSRNLGLGSSGSDVQNLELFLINRNTGPAAQALKAHGVTDYFGPLTQAALREYQVSQGIDPTGYFGVVTRGIIQK